MSAISGIKHRMEQIPAEIEPFADWLAARCPHHVIEIGVRWGGTSALWHELSTGVVVGVDWAGRDSLGMTGMREVARSLSDDYPRFRFVEGDSHSEKTRDCVVAALDARSVDFLFLDGDHSLEGVHRDWELYQPLVGSGGCVAFHDIVDSTLIRHAGHGVYRFWQALRGKKTEFSIGAEWGGIGVIEV